MLFLVELISRNAIGSLTSDLRYCKIVRVFARPERQELRRPHLWRTETWKAYVKSLQLIEHIDSSAPSAVPDQVR